MVTYIRAFLIYRHIQNLTYNEITRLASNAIKSLILCFNVLRITVLLLRSNDSTRVEVLNLLEVSGGIAIFYNCANWLTYAAVSKSFRRAYREMWAKVRANFTA